MDPNTPRDAESDRRFVAARPQVPRASNAVGCDERSSVARNHLRIDPSRQGSLSPVYAAAVAFLGLVLPFLVAGFGPGFRPNPRDFAKSERRAA